MSRAGPPAAILLFALLFGLGAPARSSGQDFPTRQVTIVSPYQPGGTSDIIARALARQLGTVWPQTPIVENRPGANGAVGIGSVVRGPADGYTWIATASTALTVNPILSRSLGYDVARDLASVTRSALVANVLVVHPSVPAASLREFIALAKAKQDGLFYASQGPGSNGHLNGELFRRAGVSMVHVPYKGSAPAVTDLLGGHVQAMFDNLPTVLNAIRGGQLRALAVTTGVRSELLPDVPTMAEAGLPGFETSAWFAVMAPKATPEPVRAQIEAAIVRALADRKVRENLFAQGVSVAAEGAAELDAPIEKDRRMWQDVIATAGIKLD